MKNYKALLLTLLIATGSLAGCGTPEEVLPDNSGEIIIPESDSEKAFDEAAIQPKGLLLNHKTLAVMVGEELELRGIQQAHHDGKSLTFKSANDAIASVDANGLVTGVSQGETTIEVADKNDPNLKISVPVSVGAELTTISRTRMLNDLGKVDESDLKSIVDHNMYEKRLYKNGVLQSYDRYDEHLVASYDDAYFRIYETDGEIRTEGGSITFSEYDWIFNTNKFYDTLVYHQVGDIKTYYPVSTVSYMESSPRYQPMFDILDNLFVSGHEVFTNIFETAKLGGFLEYAVSNYSNVKKNFFASAGDGSLIFDCTVNYSTTTADQDDETRYGIPYGTPTPTIYNLRFQVKDNKVVGFSNHGVMTYTIGEDEFEEVYDIDHLYERFDDQKSQIVIPDKSQYTLVDYLFAI